MEKLTGIPIFGYSNGAEEKAMNRASNVNATLKVIAGGMCSFMLRPARYWYEFNYCGEYSEGYHALNDRWWIKFTCP